ncbi:UQCC1-like protein [Mya arenaria]|uniref:UQCC1-like protein n=1 Tax=Mya arenaria TaxID=6604 RepID=A0ABY7F0T1_MYAAR|nr:UQCC1-like protein [Mya arenaria]
MLAFPVWVEIPSSDCDWQPSVNKYTLALYIKIKRTMSTVVAQRQEIQEEEHVSYVNQMLQRIGFKGGMRYYPEIIQLAGYRLYLSVAEAVMYNNIWKDVNMPDSFQTWHKMTSLHLWMVCTRLRLEGQEGKLARFWMVKGLLDDVKTKTDAVAKEVNLKVQKDDLEILHEQFLTGCMNYDEGILGDDRHLAAAIWRALYHHQPDIDPVHLEIMVHYIRKQVRGLQLIPSQDLLVKGLIPFYPLKGDRVWHV